MLPCDCPGGGTTMLALPGIWQTVAVSVWVHGAGGSSADAVVPRATAAVAPPAQNLHDVQHWFGGRLSNPFRLRTARTPVRAVNHACG